jgi:hypothetical protein
LASDTRWEYGRWEPPVQPPRSDFDALQRKLMLTGGGIVATLIAGIVSVVVTQL